MHLKEMNIAPRTLSRILKDDLGLHGFKRRTDQLLTPRLRVLQCEREKKLVCLYGKGKYKKTLFTDEKIFTIQQKLNRQNNRVYARSSSKASEKITRFQRAHHSPYVNRDTVLLSFIFVRKGMKTSTVVCKEFVLKPIVKPVDWTFQQDSAGAHTAKSTQK